MRYRGKWTSGFFKLAIGFDAFSVILLPAHPASFAHKFYFRESRDAIILQTCH